MKQPIAKLMAPASESVLNQDVLTFIGMLEDTFGGRRRELLKKRQEKQKKLDEGHYPDFLTDTKTIREGNWKAASIPADLQDRRVEITGPVDRKMVINALNSGAKVFMADFEDSNSPTWENCIQGQINLMDAVRGTINYTAENGKSYRLNDKTATLMVRPRGWHLEENHVLVNDKPVSASLFDFGVFFFHNAKALIAKGSGPYFYLPKMESHEEAILWNDVFNCAQDYLGIPRGTIRATVLIETINAAFEMDEILYALKEHSAGLNCGRWDYIFSFIKKFRNHPQFLLPDRHDITMTQHFLKSYVDSLIATCHKRGVHAMGGMAAQIPVKNDEKANQMAMEKVFADKKREALAGHDGTWVAHPGLIPVALEAFDAYMPKANQIDSKRDAVSLKARDFLQIPEGKITEQGVRNNISVGIQYLFSWLKGNGCVPINNLMEDAATAEICRAQLWQWLKFKAQLDGKQTFDKPLFLKLLQEETKKIEAGSHPELLKKASALFEQMITKPVFDDFLTIPAYQLLTQAKDVNHE